MPYSKLHVELALVKPRVCTGLMYCMYWTGVCCTQMLTHTYTHTWKFQCYLGLVVPISNEVLTMYMYVDGEVGEMRGRRERWKRGRREEIGQRS